MLSLCFFPTLMFRVTCTIDNIQGDSELPAPADGQEAGQVLSRDVQCRLSSLNPSSYFCEVRFKHIFLECFHRRHMIIFLLKCFHRRNTIIPLLEYVNRRHMIISFLECFHERHMIIFLLEYFHRRHKIIFFKNNFIGDKW